MKIAAPLGFLLSATFTSAGFAGAQDVSPALRQQAIATCSDDARRLCPADLFDESAAVSCLAGKRTQLTQSCRVVYDHVARVLKE